MRLNFSTKILSRYYFIITTFVLVVGIALSVGTFIIVSQNTQEILLENVATVASVFEAKSIASFSGNESDLKNPAYLSLKSKLEKIPKINDDVRFVYLWGFRDNNVYFMIDSEPPSSADYSPPGQVYTEATQIDRDMFLKNLSGTMEMNTDRWGTWLSALTPIKDDDTGKLVAVLGMDMSANQYFETVYVYTAIPIVTTIFVLALIFIDFTLRKREQEFLAYKSELVSIASHEIRSPLTGMSWLIDGLLQSKENLPPKIKEDLGTIKSKNESLLLTVNDLLDSAVAEKISQKKLVKEPIRIKTLFEEIAKDSSLVLAEKNIKLNIDPSIMLDLAILGDPDRIKRMFNNLVSNAIKYSKDGGTVTIGRTEKEKSFIFSIKDEGIGIPQKDQNKIFKGFFRAENAKKITENGTGLGLHYVKQIAELHRGRVWCESKEGEGSTFFVELPKSG